MRWGIGVFPAINASPNPNTSLHRAFLTMSGWQAQGCDSSKCITKKSNFGKFRGRQLINPLKAVMS